MWELSGNKIGISGKKIANLSSGAHVLYVNVNALFIVKVHLAIKLVHRHPTFNNRNLTET